MSTKFVSKQSNYALVLKPGVEGSRVLGTQSIPGLYVKFQAGVVDVREENIIKMIREHPSFGIDFIEIKENEVDPYTEERSELEPDHIHSEIKYGHVEKSTGAGTKPKLTPQLKKIIESEAVKMLPALLKSNPKILKEIIVNLAAEMKEKEETETKETIEETVEPTTKKIEKK